MHIALARLSRALAAAVAILLSLQPAASQVPRTQPVDGEPQRPVVVFAAASLKTALDRIGSEWRSSTGRQVTFSYASSGALARQIESGAHADIFASADVAWMDYLSGRGLIRNSTRVSLLGNRLVLVSPRDAAVMLEIAPGFALAAALGGGRLAIGDPAIVPAGAYAKAALIRLGVWQSVSMKMAGASNVRAALAFVARGEAPLGIVYATDAHAEPAVKVVATFPPDSHPPIIYPFALTAGSGNPAAAAFMAFLSTPAAKTVFTAEGFTMVAH